MQETTERENALILELCREADALGVEPLDDETEDEIILGFRSNHHPDLIAAAADGDVAALIRLRSDCGLPIFR